MKTKKKIIIIALFLILLVFIAGYFFIEITLRPTLVSMGEAKLKNMGTQILNEAISTTLGAHTSSEDFLLIEKDTSGRVSLLLPDSLAINDIALQTTLIAQAELDSIENTKFDIPIAGALGINILTNSGPYIHVIVDNIGAVRTEFTTEFSEAGINQTRYRVHLNVTADMAMLIGNSPHEVSVYANAVIAESIIVGDVPQTYANLPAENEFLNLLP